MTLEVTENVLDGMEKKAVQLVESKFSSHDLLRFEIAQSKNNFYAVEAFAITDDTHKSRFALHHWIADVETGEVWVSDSKLPFPVNIALIQRGAGFLMS